METRSQDLTLRTRALEKELFVTSAWGPKGEPELQLSSGLRVGRAERILQTYSSLPSPSPPPTHTHTQESTWPGRHVQGGKSGLKTAIICSGSRQLELSVYGGEAT